MDHDLPIGWRNLAVHLWGPEHGRPVFLMHGTPGTRLDVRVAESELRDLGIRLISYDRPGYGRSDSYPDRTVAQAAHDVRVIADAFGHETFAVIGRSGGAPHALAVAALLPDRVTRVASMAGVAPYGEPDLDWFAGMTEKNRHHYGAAIRGRSALWRVVFPEVVATRADPSAFKRRWFEASPADADQLEGGHFGDAWLASLSHAFERSFEGWAADNLAFTRPWGFDPGEIRVPTLLWHALHDVFAPVAHAHWLAERIRTATLVIAQHASHLHAGGAQLDVLRWLVADRRASSAA